MPINYIDTELDILSYHDTELDKVIYDTTTVYQRITVNYYSENNSVKSVKVVSGKAVSLSSSNAASKTGWTFLGWRRDKTASATVESSITAGTETINLYAVYRQTITLSYNGNGNTGGSTASQTGYRYYNNGNIVNPSFSLRANGFTRTNYNFINWRMGSASGTAYNAGASVTLSANTTFYASWQVATITYNNPGFSQTEGWFGSSNGSASGKYSISGNTFSTHVYNMSYGTCYVRGVSGAMNVSGTSKCKITIQGANTVTNYWEAFTVKLGTSPGAENLGKVEQTQMPNGNPWSTTLEFNFSAASTAYLWLEYRTWANHNNKREISSSAKITKVEFSN